MSHRLRWRALRAGLGGILLGAAAAAGAHAWDDFQARFVTADGAVIDDSNRLTHSEGQGYGLMFALAYNDRDAFARIYAWTRAHLRNPDNGLHYWAYRLPDDAAAGEPAAAGVLDRNNASDGDLFIAWALLKAGQIWGERSYTREADAIAHALLATVVAKYADRYVMLPGENGFYFNTHVVFNPSYLIFPALELISAHTHISTWRNLCGDSHLLIEQWQQQDGLQVPLAADWITLKAAGDMEPATAWPARAGYDAIRVPLYLFWNDPQDPQLAPWRSWFTSYADGKNPAWVNVTSGETADYAQPAGLATVRDLILGRPIREPVIAATDDYYNASLKMLSFLAYEHF